MVNAIDNRLNQASFDVYAKMESLLVNCLNCQDYSMALHFLGTNYGEDVDVRTLNVQLEIFKMLMKDREFTCLDDMFSPRSSGFLKPGKKCMISEIMTICKLLLVNPATSAAGEIFFFCSETENVATLDYDTNKI